MRPCACQELDRAASEWDDRANTGSHENPASVAILGLGVALPPLWINLQSFPRRLPESLDATVANDAFARTFRVQATDAQYATSMMSTPMMQLLMTRDDWAFAITGTTLVCVCKQPFRTVDDVRSRVAQLQRFVELIPSSVRQQRAVAMPTLPGGSMLDPDDPASAQRFHAMLAAMTPEQREQFRRQFRRER